MEASTTAAKDAPRVVMDGLPVVMDGLPVVMDASPAAMGVATAAMDALTTAPRAPTAAMDEGIRTVATRVAMWVQAGAPTLFALRLG
jgi:hypothetical protein